jgi:iron only hydrogenase large subunit-like protein
MNPPEFSFYHAHHIIEERCKARMKCLHLCPTEAIRVRRGKVTFLNDLCIDCGECITACTQDVFVPKSEEKEDFNSFAFQIAIPSPVLYAQFGPDVQPPVIHRALKNIGFDAVVDVAHITQELGFVLLHHLKMKGVIKPLISSYCPTIVRFLQVKYPNLVNHIEPFDVPLEILGKETKSMYAKKLGLKKNKIGVIYLSQCPAKIVSIKQPAEKEHSWIDGAIPIKEIYNILMPEVFKIMESTGMALKEDFHYGKDWGLLGNLSHVLGPEHCLSVAGLSHVKKIFDDIENSKLRNVDFIEALACMQGCVSGAYCVENPYIARHTAILMEKAFHHPEKLDKKNILKRYRQKVYSMEHPILPRPTRAIDSDITASIKKLRQKERILLKLPQKDCGLCGSPSCASFAEDCARGEADVTECIFFS